MYKISILSVFVILQMFGMVSAQSLEKDTINLKTVNISVKRINKISILKSNVPLQDMPVSASIVGSQLMIQKGEDNLLEVLKYSTGVRTMDNYGGFQTFKIRGFGDFGFLVDGVRDERHNLSNSAPTTSLASVERIEVLKGPASVLYGHSSLGGIINLIRKKPNSDFTLNASVSLSSWDKKSQTIGMGGALGTKVNYRFDAASSYGAGWRDRNDKVANVYLAIDYMINANNNLEFRLGANDDFYGTETGIPVFGNTIFNTAGEEVYHKGDFPDSFNRNQRFNDPQDFLTHKNYNASIKWNHKFNSNWRLMNYSTFSDDDIDYLSTESLSFLSSDDNIYDNYYISSGKRKYISVDSLKRSYPLRFSHKTKTAQNSLEINGTYNTGVIKHNVLIGYSFSYIDRISYTGYGEDDIYGDGKYANISIKNPVLNQGSLMSKFSGAHIAKEYNNAIYVQNYLDISTKLKALVALRFDLFNRSYQKASVNSGLHIYDKSLKKKLKNNALTYRLGLVYKPISSTSIYASVTNYFKPSRTVANKNYIYINNKGDKINADGDNIWEPTTGYQFELGTHFVKTEKWQANASVYYIRKQNIVEYLGKDSKQQRVYGQVGAADSRGFELDIKLKPVKCISIDAGYTFNITKYRDFVTNDCTTNNLEGNYYPHTPKHTVFAWMYACVFKNENSRFNLGFGGQWNDKAFTKGANTYSFHSYAKFDASLKYSFNDYYLNFNINNLFDKEYEENTVYSNQFIPSPERNFKLTIGFKI